MFALAELIPLLIILATVYTSYRGFSNRAFFERYVFHVERIIAHHETLRIVSSAFLHANWPHLIFNMFALYSFSAGVQQVFGTGGYLLIYFGSLVAGSLLALSLHRGHGAYRAVGASGAVSGVVFASIAAFPRGTIGFLLLPVGIPAWLFGIGFVLISIFGIGARAGNIGHEAHLGGAIAGIALALMLRPGLVAMHPGIVIAIAAPLAAFLYIVVRYPYLLRVRIELRGDPAGGRSEADHRRRLQEEMDRLLDKVGRHGIQGLTARERKRLQDIAEEQKRMKR